MSFRKKAVSGFGWSFLIQSSFLGINFIISILLARLLLPEDFGLVGMIAIFIAVGKALVEGGLSSSLIRAEKTNNSDYDTVFLMNLALSLIVYGILFTTAPLIAEFFGYEILSPLIRVSGLIFLINAVSIVQSTILNKKLDFKTQFKLQLPSLVLSGITGITMALYDYGVWSIVGRDLTFAVFASIQLWFYSSWKPTLNFNKERFNYHLKYGLSLTGANVMDAAFKNFYHVIIGKFFTAYQLGLYTRARSLEQLPSAMVFAVFNRVSFPLLSTIQGEDQRMKNIYRRIMEAATFVVVPVLIIVAVLAEPIILFLLTEKWIDAVPYLQILALSGIFIPFAKFNLNICKVKDRSDLVFKLSLVQNLLILLSGIAAIFYGILFLLWSIVLVTFVMALINAHFSGRLINYSLGEQLKDISGVFLLGIVMGVILFFIDKYVIRDLFTSDFLRLVTGSLTGVGVYFTLAYLSRIDALKELIKISRDI